MEFVQGQVSAHQVGSPAETLQRESRSKVCSSKGSHEISISISTALSLTWKQAAIGFDMQLALQTCRNSAASSLGMIGGHKTHDFSVGEFQTYASNELIRREIYD